MESEKAKANTNILKREIGMKVTSVRIRNMELVNTTTKQWVSILDILRTIRDMEKEYSIIRLVINMLVGSNMVRNMEKVFMNSIRLLSSYKENGMMAL